MSYNNFTDADAAWRAAFDHEQTCVAIIKHANPCGIAISSVSVADAHRKAHDCDPLSAFGGVIAANTEVSVEMAEYVGTIFTEVIVAPAYAPGALDVLTRKKNIRVLVASEPLTGGNELRPISGGLLIQQRDQLDAHGDNPLNWTLATGKPADPATLTDLVFAWRSCRAVKSNAIVIAADGATIGVGMGQVNRVDAARLAVERGGDAGAAARSRPPTRSSRSRTGWRRWPPPESRRSCTPAARCATTKSPRPRPKRASRCTSPELVTSRTRDLAAAPNFGSDGPSAIATPRRDVTWSGDLTEQSAPHRRRTTGRRPS